MKKFRLTEFIFQQIILFLKAIREDFDVLIVGYTGGIYITTAKIICILKNKPLVFDIFISAYDALVNDRTLVNPKSIKAKFLYYYDKYCCKVSDIILLDTNESIDFFKKEFNLYNRTFKRIFIGSMPIKHRIKTKPDKFTVLFWGYFIPLQGCDIIVRAAKLLENDTIFRLIGDGQTFEECKKLKEKLNVKNIIFEGRQNFNYIEEAMQTSNIALGIFGKGRKAKRHIPHKAYEAIAGNIPLLTGNSPAIHELFTPGENCLVCDFEDEKSLADQIALVMKESPLLEKINQSGFELYNANCTPKVIGKQLKEILNDCSTNFKKNSFIN